MKLEKPDYYIVEPFLSELTCGCAPAYAYDIVDGAQHGIVYVDNKKHPTCVYLKHSCGFTYILGDPNNKEFLKELYGLLLPTKKFFMICLQNKEWERIIRSFSDLTFEYGQHFSFELKKEPFYLSNYPLPSGYKIVPIDHETYETLQGKVIPRHYWNSAQQFLEHGYGVCLLNPKKQIVSSSFSACIAKNRCDIGIQTQAGFEEHGFATLTAARMVQYALDHGYDPVWGCNSKNVGSYSVAHKLGFKNNGCCNTICGGIC